MSSSNKIPKSQFHENIDGNNDKMLMLMTNFQKKLNKKKYFLSFLKQVKILD